MESCYALIGWSLPVMESMKRAKVTYVVVSFPEFTDYALENHIPFIGWDLNHWEKEQSAQRLYEALKTFHVNIAVPIYEETVEWAGALNVIYRNEPHLYHQALLFRNKPIMKRRAYLWGIKVGLFDEANSVEEVRSFFKKINETCFAGDEEFWVHLKQFSKAGTVGHRLLKNMDEIEQKVTADLFPCMVESHLKGREFSTEGFVHNGTLKFLNITDYVHLGHSNYVPAGPDLESKRHSIELEVNKLLKAFNLKYGFIHAEWFIDQDDEISFGEVAGRIPGGHLMEMMSEAYGFDAFHAFVRCYDPNYSQEELDQIFPNQGFFPEYHSGCLMIYPKTKTITKLNIPEALRNHLYFQNHTLIEPFGQQKVINREGFGNHYGTIFFKGKDPVMMKETLQYFEDAAYYV